MAEELAIEVERAWVPATLKYLTVSCDEPVSQDLSNFWVKRNLHTIREVLAARTSNSFPIQAKQHRPHLLNDL